MAISSSMCKTSLIYNFSKEKVKSFLEKNSCDCKRTFYYKTPSLYCCDCVCFIDGLKNYYSPTNGEYETLCEKCYKEKQEKQQWKLIKNNRIYEEPMVTCQVCCKLYHALCGMANMNNLIKGKDDFICPRCIYNYLEKHKLNHMITPNSWLSTIHKTPNIALLKETVLSIKIESSLCDASLFVREMISTPKEKTLALFQRCEDEVYVFLFLASVQYLDDNLYLSYIDSIHYYNNKEKRTWVYQTFLLSIFDHARKSKNVKKAFLWSMPPTINHDYFFNKHPESQQIPDQNRLTMWYINLFERGKEEEIISEYLNLHEFIRKEEIISLNNLPKFDGDFWPSIIEKNKTEEENTELVFTQIEKGQKYLLMCYLKEMDLPTMEEAENIFYPFFANREAFTDHCSTSLFQFHTLRNAKHSTMMILYYLCNPTLHFETVICNKCHYVIPLNETFFTDATRTNYEFCKECAFNNAPSVTGMVPNLPIVIQLAKFNAANVKDHLCQVEQGRCLFCIENGVLAHSKTCLEKECPIIMCQFYKKKQEEKLREYNKIRSHNFLLSL